MSKEQLTIHGRRIGYWAAGSGESTVLLIHGLCGRAEQWRPVIDRLGKDCTVLAPDLPGYGSSSRPSGDYSLGAYAATLRDFMLAGDFSPATVVGHSLGGGIAMQFAYHFPDLTERLVLVSSGGLGREVHPLLRAAALPGAELFMRATAAGTAPLKQAGALIGNLLGHAGFRPRIDVEELIRGYTSLANATERETFVNSVRSVIDTRGQRASAIDRLYLAAEMPTMIVWGKNDPVIPAEHATVAHEGMPNSRLELFEGVGHFPQLEDSKGLTEILLDFLATTEPRADPEAFRRRLRQSSLSEQALGRAA